MRKVCNFIIFLFLCIFSEPAILSAQEEVEEKGMTLIELLRAGGPVMIPLLLCSVVAIALIIYFLFSLRERRIFPRRFISDVESTISQGNVTEAITICKKSKRMIASILLAGLELNNRSIEKIREKMERKGALVFGDIRKNIEYLNMIGVIAPMLGLLGTVTGMIVCFNNIAFKAGIGNPKLLAGGISQALVTTATGLPIGILALCFYIYYREKMTKVTTLMGDVGEKFIDLLEDTKNKK